MITKLLFTAAVVVVVYLLFRTRLRQGGEPADPPPRLPAPATPAASAQPARILAYGLVSLLLVGSAGYLFLQWRGNQEIVVVRVVNAHNGESVTYRARRGEIQGRRFTTLDGRRVILADVERIELESGR
jgi:hypothetical protein